MKTAVTSKHTRLEVILLVSSISIAAMLLMLLLTDSEEYKSSVLDESYQVKNVISQNDWTVLHNETLALQDKWVNESGLYKWFLSKLVPEKDTEWDGVVGSTMQERLAINGQILAYQIALRITMFKYWFFVSLPLCIALIYGSINKYKANAYKLGGAKPNLVRLYIKIIWISFCLFTFFMLAPNFVGGALPYFPFIYLIIISLLISGIIRNFHKGTS
ncbi:MULTISPECIES: hypothetical protein [unclassified Pseudoalteromonas]|uniref:hypothetical protein n=1 Tax=unclassified Pseudoalteromonas TaxID=194690 RepID=UPI0023593F74|nr:MULTISPECIES: hypothetical protein [unclassified Pseudoalteromonas]MDC9563462.1 hypothetical protein [Pseudoalteromonas sp. GAB2316C]MDC9572056.1 hypothetical protein [Pseudoalteromonas sp. GABNS16A]MDC9583909.1 hypothetical protein [Pseudoalteromonas sp. GABNS16C]MDC9607822.1 hypothetical protein [Pseudoalteromonas sp. GABNS16H]